MVGPDRPEMTIQRMRFRCRIIKATNTLSEYVILFALPRQRLVNPPQCYVIRALPVLSLNVLPNYLVNL